MNISDFKFHTIPLVFHIKHRPGLILSFSERDQIISQLQSLTVALAFNTLKFSCIDWRMAYLQEKRFGPIAIQLSREMLGPQPSVIDKHWPVKFGAKLHELDKAARI